MLLSILLWIARLSLSLVLVSEETVVLEAPTAIDWCKSLERSEENRIASSATRGHTAGQQLALVASLCALNS